MMGLSAVLAILRNNPINTEHPNQLTLDGVVDDRGRSRIVVGSRGCSRMGAAEREERVAERVANRASRIANAARGVATGTCIRREGVGVKVPRARENRLVAGS